MGWGGSLEVFGQVGGEQQQQQREVQKVRLKVKQTWQKFQFCDVVLHFAMSFCISLAYIWLRNFKRVSVGGLNKIEAVELANQCLRSAFKVSGNPSARR